MAEQDEMKKKKAEQDEMKKKKAEQDESILNEEVQNIKLDDDGAEEDNSLESLETFLDDNNVHKDWKDLILNDESVKSGLDNARDFLKKYTPKGKFIPHNKIILRAFHADFGGPNNIKAVILGYDPIPYAELATGLAFSLPPGYTQVEGKGKAVTKLNKALAEVNTGYKGRKSLCNEHLAKNDILLLNAALTIGRSSPGNERLPRNERRKRDFQERRQADHFKAWRDFTFNILKTLLWKLKKDHDQDLIILCWGTNAKEIGENLREEFPQNKENIMLDCDHPTYSESGEQNNNFHTEAPEQFRKILEKYPDIFNK